jgi:hypothetical protein
MGALPSGWSSSFSRESVPLDGDDGDDVVDVGSAVEADRVADDVEHAVGQPRDVLAREGVLDRAAVVDGGVDGTGQPGHGREVRTEGDRDVPDAAVADRLRRLRDTEHDLVGLGAQRQVGDLAGAGHVHGEHGRTRALRGGDAHRVDVHLPGVDAAARDQHGSVGGDTALEVDGHLGHAAARRDHS